MTFLPRFAMRARLAVALLGLALALACAHEAIPTQTPYDRSWPSWNAVLANYAAPEGVDYAALKAHPQKLEQALAEFQAVRPETFDAWSDADRLAYLINVHNAFTVKRIVDSWPVRSIAETRSVGSPFKAHDVPVLGREWSLLELRERVMSAEFLQARALFLLNWGERGCAPLPQVAVTGLNLADLMERQPRLFMANPAYFKYQPLERRITVSELFLPYEEDFIRDFTKWQIFFQRYGPDDKIIYMKTRPPRIRFEGFDHRVNYAPEPAGETAQPVKPAPAK